MSTSTESITLGFANQEWEARKMFKAGLDTVADLNKNQHNLTYPQQEALSTVALAQFKAAELLRLSW